MTLSATPSERQVRLMVFDVARAVEPTPAFFLRAAEFKYDARVATPGVTGAVADGGDA